MPPEALEGDLARHDTHAAMLLHLMPKPTIAMVGGPAIGAGFSLAAACDLRFAADDAVFAAGFTPNGLAGDYGGTFWWTRIAGTATARRLYLLNEKLTADQALGLGMVHAVLPAAELRAHVMDLASRLARIPRGGRGREGQPQPGRGRGRPATLPIRQRGPQPGRGRPGDDGEDAARQREARRVLTTTGSYRVRWVPTLRSR